MTFCIYTVHSGGMIKLLAESYTERRERDRQRDWKTEVVMLLKQRGMMLALAPCLNQACANSPTQSSAVCKGLA